MCTRYSTLRDAVCTGPRCQLEMLTDFHFTISSLDAILEHKTLTTVRFLNCDTIFRAGVAVALYYVSFLLAVALVLVNVVIAVLLEKFGQESTERRKKQIQNDTPTLGFQPCSFLPLTR